MELSCWKCGAGLSGVIMPLSRREECPECRAELHVCRQCEHYDAQISDQCREDRAEQVSDKTRANFCDYFKLKPDVQVAQSGSSAVSAELAGLFGLDTDVIKPENPLDQLFDSSEPKGD